MPENYLYDSVEQAPKDSEETPLCFVIMPISNPSNYPTNHFTLIYEQIFKAAIEDAGYKPIRVDEDHISDSIIYKIFDYIQTCPMALCDLSSRNPNVLYELGLRQAYDLPVVLVQDERTERIFDVSGINTIPYSSDRLYESVLKARSDITSAIRANSQGKTQNYSLVKLLSTKKATLEMKPISPSDFESYQLTSIQEEIKEIKRFLRNEIQPNISRNLKLYHSLEAVGSYDISNNYEHDRVNAMLKLLLNELRKKSELTEYEYTHCSDNYFQLRSRIDDLETSVSSKIYNDLRQLLNAIEYELSRLQKQL